MDVATIAAVVGTLATIAGLLLEIRRRKERSRVGNAIPLTANAPLPFIPIETANKPEIRRIQSTADDPDLHAALDLYCRRIPENERDSDEDIVRWIDEVEAETKEGTCSLKDYFLVATIAGRVLGMLYAHYYPSRKLAFLSYLVIDDKLPEAQHSHASAELLDRLFVELRSEECDGIVFELAHSAVGSAKAQREARGRMRRFRRLARAPHRVIVKEIGMDYRQPKLSLWEEGRHTEKQHLFYGRMKPPALETTLSRIETERILRFIFGDIYGDEFEDDDERERKFRDYLTEQYEKLTAKLPAEITLN